MTDAIIEAAARALQKFLGVDSSDIPSRPWLSQAEAVLAAVTPLIRAAALEEASEWKTMENAPKDGTHFLWCEELRGRCAVIYWPTYKECFTTGYWHPLPPPPAESSAA
jgi:hypothetical protein